MDKDELKKSFDWFKPKGYLHFTPKISREDLKWLYPKLNDSNFIKNHTFFPFINLELKTRRFRRVRDNSTNILSKNRVKLSNKIRQIYYSTHIDAHIYAFYAHLLGKLYENKIENSKISEVALAYRKIPTFQGSEKNKSNIDFANEIFDAIKFRKTDCIAITIDIKSFFDCLDHELLKSAWAHLLNVDYLPKDHYNIYKSLTKFSSISLDNILKELNISHINELREVKDNKLCTPKVFREKLVQYINKNKKKVGIPQGSALSAFLSNLYMIDFDYIMVEFIENVHKGIYRRYSDDIIIVLDSNAKAKEIEEYLSISISEIGLEINQDKTERILFKRNEENILNSYWIKGYGASSEIVLWEKEGSACMRPLYYLGFTFDGSKKLIRSQSISKYYRDVKRMIRISSYKSYKRFKNSPEEYHKLFKRKIYKLSHLYNRNYYGYAKRASVIMSDSKWDIRKQLSRHMKIIKDEINKREINI